MQPARNATPRGLDPDRRRRVPQQGPRAIPRAPTSQHDTLGTLPGRAWAALPDPEGRQRFGGLAVGASAGRLAADFGTASPCGRPLVWPPRRGRRSWVRRRDFRVGRCSRLSPWTTRMQRNVRARDRSQRAAPFAGGGRSRLRAFAAGGLPGDCARGAAGGAAVQSPPSSAHRVGAMDRGADGRAGGFHTHEAANVCRDGTTGKLAGVAWGDRGGWR